MKSWSCLRFLVVIEKSLIKPITLCFTLTFDDHLVTMLVIK